MQRSRTFQCFDAFPLPLPYNLHVTKYTDLNYVLEIIKPPWNMVEELLETFS